MAGKPNIPISTIRTRRSKIERTIKSCTNDGANSSFDLSLTRKNILKMLTTTPAKETKINEKNRRIYNSYQRILMGRNSRSSLM